MGLGVCEMNDKKAILEVDGLMREIYGDECALVKAFNRGGDLWHLQINLS